MDKEGQLFIFDGINNELSEIDNLEDAKIFIEENFIEDGKIHPDIESVFIVKKVASVKVEETEQGTQLGGKFVPICKVTIQ